MGREKDTRWRERLEQKYIPGIVAVKCRDGLAHILEDVALHQDLRAISRIDACVRVQEITIVDVTCAEAERGGARTDVGPVVVVLSHGQVAGVFGAVAIRVPDEGGFVVLVEVGV